ncbi:ornithine cyclodeaminase [Devosia sp.]|uniref:ornithine cyclodeaminase n=1 Tax=Devosia sp. TaxID=1871048 RepID=UPI002EE392B7
MVVFVGVGDLKALVQAKGLDVVLPELVGYLEHDFRRWDAFDKVARLASHSDIGVIELMPTSDGQLYAFKFVNGHPINPSTGHLTVTAFGALADVRTGYPLLISEMTLLTALRTAATSALAARALARPDSRRMALIGTGAQSEFQAHAFRALLGIETLSIYDVDGAAMDKFVANMAGSGLVIERAGSAAQAARGADIVTTVTADKANATILELADIAPGTHLNAVGGDCPGKTELAADILTAGRVFVEFTAQSRIEGEIQQMPADFPVTELWQVLTAAAPGRAARDDITVFDSVGFAIEDFSALRYLLDSLPGRRRSLDLVPELDDPKDLFGALAARQAPALVA